MSLLLRDHWCHPNRVVVVTWHGHVYMCVGAINLILQLWMVAAVSAGRDMSYSMHAAWYGCIGEPDGHVWCLYCWSLVHIYNYMYIQFFDVVRNLMWSMTKFDVFHAYNFWCGTFVPKIWRGPCLNLTWSMPKFDVIHTYLFTGHPHICGVKFSPVCSHCHGNPHPFNEHTLQIAATYLKTHCYNVHLPPYSLSQYILTQYVAVYPAVYCVLMYGVLCKAIVCRTIHKEHTIG